MTTPDPNNPQAPRLPTAGSLRSRWSCGRIRARHPHQPQGADRHGRGRPAPHRRPGAAGAASPEPARRRSAGALQRRAQADRGRLSKLPASYDGLPPDKKAPTGKGWHPACRRVCRTGQPGECGDEADRAEKARLARMAAEAREFQVFFRLQLKAPPKETVTAEARPDPLLRPRRQRQ